MEIKPMKLKLLFIALLYLTSCNLTGGMEKVKKMNAELSAAFQHKEVNIKRMWGTEEEDNKLAVFFYEYPVEKKTVKELEQTGFQVTEWLLRKYPELKDLSQIEVLFSKQPYSEKDGGSFTSYIRLKKDF